MPPPRSKLHKVSGKRRLAPVKLAQTVDPAVDTPGTSFNDSANNNSTLTMEQEQQFQIELCWCVQQLQTALSTGKLTNKQIHEHTKALNTLMGSSAPMVKKRQVMKLSFGDYRTKIAEEEKKAKKMSITVGTSRPSDKSTFLRKALMNSTGGNFKFNFPNPQEDCSEQPTLIESTSDPKIAILTKSDNSFRFNFPSNEPNGS